MVGAICKWDILAHPVVTIRCFGWKVFFRALVANHRRTFLTLLIEADVIEAPADESPDLVGRCVDLELCAKGIYETLRQRFGDPEPVGQFFDTLARQEQEHAELLRLCRAATGQEDWDEKQLDPWRAALPQLERQMSEAESWIDGLGTLADALRLVVQIESSEINQVYLAVVAASESEFVRKLDVFLESGREHIDYICRRIPEFEPQFGEVCQTLYDAYTGGIPTA